MSDNQLQFWQMDRRGGGMPPSRATLGARLRHAVYTSAWKKFEPVWEALIRSGCVYHALPVLEAVLEGVGRRRRVDQRRSADGAIELALDLEGGRRGA